MPRKKSLVLTDHELRLMEVLWAKQQATVADVTARAAAADTSPTTPCSPRCERSSRRATSRTRRPVERIPIARSSSAATRRDRPSNHVLARFFQNSPNALAVALLDDVPLRDADREQIRTLLERKAKGRAMNAALDSGAPTPRRCSIACGKARSSQESCGSGAMPAAARRRDPPCDLAVRARPRWS